jgi:hypothetical protein
VVDPGNHEEAKEDDDVLFGIQEDDFNKTSSQDAQHLKQD